MTSSKILSQFPNIFSDCLLVSPTFQFHSVEDSQLGHFYFSFTWKLAFFPPWGPCKSTDHCSMFLHIFPVSSLSNRSLQSHPPPPFFLKLFSKAWQGESPSSIQTHLLPLNTKIHASMLLTLSSAEPHFGLTWSCFCDIFSSVDPRKVTWIDLGNKKNKKKMSSVVSKNSSAITFTAL